MPVGLIYLFELYSSDNRVYNISFPIQTTNYLGLNVKKEVWKSKHFPKIEAHIFNIVNKKIMSYKLRNDDEVKWLWE